MSGGEIFIFSFVLVVFCGGGYAMYKFVKSNKRERQLREEKRQETLRENQKSES